MAKHKIQNTQNVKKNKKKKTAETQTCQEKHKMFDRCKTWNVLKMANKKCAYTKCLTDGEMKIADKNTKYLTDSKLQKHKYTLKERREIRRWQKQTHCKKFCCDFTVNYWLLIALLSQ